MAKPRDIPGLTPDLPYQEAAARTIRVRAEELRDHLGGVLDTDDIERVHDARVATRRLRAALEIYAPCFDEDAFTPVLKDVKALADALGARRDPDVQLDALEAVQAKLRAPDRKGIAYLADDVRAEQEAGNEVLRQALDEAQQHDLHGRLLQLAHAGETS